MAMGLVANAAPATSPPPPLPSSAVTSANVDSLRSMPLPRPRPRDNPEDMFTPEENFARNRQWAKPGPYTTRLSPKDEREFQSWAKDEKIHTGDYEGPKAVYDMRGFWKAMKSGDERAQTAINPYDNQRHFPDAWKTPYAATFSDESVHAVPGKTPKWESKAGTDQYVTPGGHVIFDDAAGRWYGLPEDKE